MNSNGHKTIKVSDVIFRDDLYPRIEVDPKIIQRYAENLEVLPPIEVNQHNELIDGYHRLTAHRKAEAETIQVTVTPTNSDIELLALACERNATHGLQLAERDKKSMAIRLYNVGTGMSKDQIAKVLSVTPRSVTTYLTDVDKQLREQRKARIFDMWMACYTQEEIAEACGISVGEANSEVKLFSDLEALPKMKKVDALYLDKDFTAPLYNVWTFAKKTNEVTHPGNSEQTILDYLLYLYTEPFDIVFDPFAGGGATINVCQNRARRYWVSDRKPIVELKHKIRELDIVAEIPRLAWSDVTLTYLDPPYWRQAYQQYSKDPQDLANMSIDNFTSAMCNVVKGITAKQQRGIIAMLMQPTQWNAPERQFTDHVLDIINGVSRSKRLVLENRVSCPYSTQQALPQMVEWAKENKKLLVLSRELIIWRIVQ